MSDSTLSFTNLQTTWTSNRYYTVGLIGFVLGLSNTLHLFNNMKVLGAGFLGPYLLFSTALGIPLVILELSLSQYGQKGLIRIWALCPVFKGMGYLCLLYLLVMLVEDLSVLAYLARYMINSFSTQSGWDSCNNDWNTEYCFTLETNVSKRLDCYDLHGKPKCDKALWESSHNQYWWLVVQNIDIGMFQWKSVGYCLGVTLIAYAITFKGIMVIEKVVYWSLIFAAIEFTILLYCSLIQRGSGSGLVYIFYWDWNVFKNKTPWIICFEYVINSNGIGGGGLRTLGAQNKFRGHSYLNALMLMLVNITVTTLYGVLYFSLCGNLSYFSSQSIEEIMGDTEPEFWSKVPRMLQRLDGPERLWQWIFYSQVFLVVFSKCMLITFVIVRTIFNRFPKVENYFMVISCAVYAVAFLCGTTMFTSFSTFIQKQLIWMVVKGPMILLMNLIQTGVILYIYGLTTVVDDLHFMLGFRLPFYWQILLFLSPAILCVMWIMSVWEFYEKMRVMDISVAKQLMMNAVLYLPIYSSIGYSIYYMRWMIWKCHWENVFRPSDSWYLSDPILRKSRQMFSAMSMTKEYLYRQTKKQEKAAYDLDETAYEQE
ncbi:creatine transporter-like [Coccinella septempunctata]|uniref:creatine transporter-like n=1 Tax=Coccinella septempunctata TaxID=41139 RepID=UPI001D08F56C|nr:creatine transporter-like [Coccinella septempunctata]